MNVGILGHVDSGKTTLARVLSTEASTGAFDKHARSAGARGNTIDVGLSAVTVAGIRLTLLDCPGHSTLIRYGLRSSRNPGLYFIKGGQLHPLTLRNCGIGLSAVLAVCPVFDLALLVIAADRGIEPQTAEHLILISLICPDHLIVVMNKRDLVDADVLRERERHVARVLRANGLGTPAVVAIEARDPLTLPPLMDALATALYTPTRISTGNFLMCVDHCFAIRGQGTVMTGTVIDGTASAGMEIEIPCIASRRRVKSLQSWHVDVAECTMGERVALLLPQLPADAIDRTLVAAPGVLTGTSEILATFNAIPHFKHALKSRSKLHVSIGTDTVLADCCFLIEEKHGDLSEYELIGEIGDQHVNRVLMRFERVIYTRMEMLLIAARLDASAGKACRFAFSGRVTRFFPTHSSSPDLRIFTRKTKRGRVERVESETTAIATALFKKETKIEQFRGMHVLVHVNGDEQRCKRAVIESSFGKSGKTRIRFVDGLDEDDMNCLKTGSSTVTLHFKKYSHDGSIVSYVP